MKHFTAEEHENVDQVTCMVDKGRAVAVIYKAFDTVVHSILLKKLVAHGMEESLLDKIWLDDQA